ncbi:MAG: hypothetical protein EAZ85_06860 [Bacteroidetes bacterium]|nr:MAG: hypothetical protein EAZ85_06860 [Bacteroidota bacterium]TAG89540.1 MAG: hypothetical protein EAZ20_06265 [Bacteroidota bacterium]
MKYRFVFVLCFFLFSKILFSQNYSNLNSNLSIEDALKIAQEKENAGDKKESTRYLNHAASICWENKNYACATQWFEKSMQLNKEIGNENGVLMLHNNLGMIAADQKQYQNAIVHFDYTLTGRKKTKDKVGMISSLINLSVCHNNLKQYNQSIQKLEESLEYARQMSDANQMRSCYGMLAETYDKAGNSDKSRYYFDLYRLFHEKVQKDRDIKARIEVEKSKFEAEKANLIAKDLESDKKIKELELEVKERELLNKDFSLKAKDEELKDTKDSNMVLFSQKTKAELAQIASEKEKEVKNLKIKQIQSQQERQKIVQYALIVGVILLILFLSVLALRYGEKKKSNKLLNQQNVSILEQQQEITQQRDYIFSQNQNLAKTLEELHKKSTQITASIEYAFRIQTAMMTNAKLLQKFPADDFFILWKPRDIVSGDFYWIAEKEDKYILAVADCTGHGVPGAFMSMIGDSLLNQIIHDKEIIEPNLILDALNEGIFTTLNQKDSQNKDGMDIALIVVDSKTKILKYAGANNSLYYLQNDIFHEIKANKFGIGGTITHRTGEPRYFSVHEVDVSVPTQFYLYSDGYADQFGGENNRKFMSKNFKELLTKIHHEPAQVQRKILNETIMNWMTHKENQIDDILVVGGKINF